MLKLVAAAVLTLAAVAPATAATYVTDTATFTGLGDTIGSPFDEITLNSVTGTATTPGTYLVNTVDFTVGLNSNDSHISTGTFTNTATIDGSPVSYTVPYTISISSADTITIGGNTVTIDGFRVFFNPLTLASDGTFVASGDLTATVSVPEPTTWAMMVAGFGLVGLGVRRRRVDAVTA